MIPQAGLVRPLGAPSSLEHGTQTSCRSGLCSRLGASTYVWAALLVGSCCGLSGPWAALRLLPCRTLRGVLGRWRVYVLHVAPTASGCEPVVAAWLRCCCKAAMSVPGCPAAARLLCLGRGGLRLLGPLARAAVESALRSGLRRSSSRIDPWSLAAAGPPWTSVVPGCCGLAGPLTALLGPRVLPSGPPGSSCMGRQSWLRLEARGSTGGFTAQALAALRLVICRALRGVLRLLRLRALHGARASLGWEQIGAGAGGSTRTAPLRSWSA